MFRWLLRLIAWDGLLPCFVWTVPFVIKQVVPNRPELIHMTAVFLPPAMLLIRMRLGAKIIAENHCSPTMRSLQFLALILGIMLLGLIDGVLILVHVIPKPLGPFDDATGRMISLVVVGTYLLLMAFAMYPGRRTVADLHSKSP